MQNPVNLLGPSDGFMLLNLLVGFIFIALIIGFPVYVIVRFLRAYERRTRVRDVDHGQEQQLEAMRETIERLEQEVQRLSEAQQFTTNLLTQNATGASRDKANRAATTPAP